MPRCAVCGEPAIRRKRGPLEKIFSRAVYRCGGCNATLRVSQPFFGIFQRYCECPACGTRELSKLAVRDKIDRMSPNPLRRLLFFFRCPIYHCTFCRLQFRDWRGREPQREGARGPAGASQSL